MNLILSCAALGGFIYYYETRRPDTFLKESRKARLGIYITKWTIIIGFFAAVFFGQKFFIDHFMSLIRL